ncbi:MAG TPA: amylo-alpha-1,6-glucosidase [Thermoanaerobaculia bacterium]|nr:amylo-alpha-1,6-glucosidase [Thermoanaerobaculia bacterium]
MEEQTTASEREVGTPLTYSGAELAARALSVEWLETDGLGGFASGTAAGARTRRHHGLYAPAIPPLERRLLLVAGCEEFVVAGGERSGISTQLYRDAVYPDGRPSLASFALDPFPTWIHRSPHFSVERSFCLPRGRSLALVRWTNHGSRAVELTVRPLLAYRRLHELQRELGFVAATEISRESIVVRPNGDLPALRMRAFGARISNQPDWYRRFHYPVDEERGHEADEDLWSPLLWKWEILPGRHVWAAFACEEPSDDPAAVWETERERRGALPRTGDATLDELAGRAEAFLVETPDGGCTILSGYPSPASRARDAMMAAPGLAIALGRYRPFARSLNAFASKLTGGLLPSESPDDGSGEGYGSIDAPLWFILAVDWFGRARRDPSQPSPLLPAVREIVDAYREGTRFGIRAGEDLLVSGGEPGRALTWMNAVVDGEPVTPRHGRPVEVNALWHAALKAAARLERLSGEHARARKLEGDAWRAARRFNELFWDEENGRLYDVVGADGPDASLRPNQILAVALDSDLLPPHRARAVYWSVRRHLLTPFGLRTLDPRDPRYRPRCEGREAERDRALHQGTVWPALLGPFVDAHFRVLGRTPESVRTVRGWLAPLLAHVREAGAGSISQTFDGDPPHAPGGSFAHAVGVAELARIVHTHFGG